MADKPAPSALRIFLLLCIAMALIVGVQMIWAHKKLNSPSRAGSLHSAAIAEHEMASADGPMTDDQKAQFVEEVKAARVRQATQDLTGAKKLREAAAFGRKLEGLWRTMPDENGRSYELQAGLQSLNGDQFLTEVRRLEGTMPWVHTPYKIVSIESAGSVQLETKNVTRMLKIQPCRQVITEHSFSDCLSFFDGSGFDGSPVIEVAYRAGGSSADERAALIDAKSSFLQRLSKYGEDQMFR